MAQLKNPHPGEILKSEFLDELGMSQNALADALGVPRNRIHAIVNGTRGITADTDLRLCRFFRLSEGYFLRLQNAYETMEAKRAAGEKIARIKPLEQDGAYSINEMAKRADGWGLRFPSPRIIPGASMMRPERAATPMSICCAT